MLLWEQNQCCALLRPLTFHWVTAITPQTTSARSANRLPWSPLLLPVFLLPRTRTRTRTQTLGSETRCCSRLRAFVTVTGAARTDARWGGASSAFRRGEGRAKGDRKGSCEEWILYYIQINCSRCLGTVNINQLRLFFGFNFDNK